MADKREKSKEERAGKVINALNHPLRRQILQRMIKEGRAKSPNELSQDLNQPLGNISYHVKILFKSDCLKLIKTEPRRGALEHFYEATVQEDWVKNILGVKVSG